ncbi:hypothetical protein BK004_04590 [bacterium CG10_46_32]|nr:MAG: hypothetical protein BK004_04590 [bacterium CG10_46_32]PIR55720.1 MAG: hypothetical protein COU73_04630 [Parcubacteria group bacterium CG10_big_fil_rev_8_21_14_0_10_46_32]
MSDCQHVSTRIETQLIGWGAIKEVVCCSCGDVLERYEEDSFGCYMRDLPIQPQNGGIGLIISGVHSQGEMIRPTFEPRKTRAPGWGTVPRRG